MKRSLRLQFLGGDTMIGRAIQLSLPEQCPGEERITDSIPALYYFFMAMGLPRHIDKKAASEAFLKVRSQNNHAEYLWGDLPKIKISPSPDVRVLNLETAVTATIEGDDIPAKGINYHSHIKNATIVIEALQNLENGNVPLVISMANNHFLDFGRKAFESDTLKWKFRNQLVGVGNSRNEAAAPLKVPLHSTDIHFVAAGSECAGIPKNWDATPNRSGLLWLPQLHSQKHVDTAFSILKGSLSQIRGGIKVLSIHWGPNWATSATTPGVHPGHQPWRQQLAHRLIDEGLVDIIYGHSSHHMRGMEIYKSRLILYGCGDLVNDYEGFSNPGDEVFSTEGGIFVVDVDASTGEAQSLRIIPMQMNNLKLERVKNSSKMRKFENVSGAEGIATLCERVNNLSTFDTGTSLGRPVKLKVVENDSNIPDGPILFWSNANVSSNRASTETESKQAK